MDADVVVIGAGAAGLAAARVLAKRSLRTIVLEARDRVGGRAWSHPSPRASVPSELGAEFIHGAARETAALLREAGTAALDIGGESWTCNGRGELRRDDADFPSAAAIFEAVRTLREDESVDAFLKRFDGDAATRARARLARAFVEGFDAAEPEVASVRSIAEEWRSGIDSTSGRPLGGYRPMFDYLRSACDAAGVELRLSTRVTRVAWPRGAVAVDAVDHRGAPQIVRARAAIVTLPAGVLRHAGDETAVAFEPELPATKREALCHIVMGHVAKVALWFHTAFWERLDGGRFADASFFRCDGAPFAVYWTQVPVRSELVAAWAGGPQAIALRGASEPQLIALALDGFGAALGARDLVRDEFEAGATHDWFGDPFARGAYSYVTVGGDGARRALAAPVDDTLFFAGEAASTDGQGGTVNGALETGERAAREAAGAIG